MSKLKDSQKPADMPRALWENLKAQHDGGSVLDQTVVLELLDKLIAREEAEPHPAEQKFANLVGLDNFEPEQKDATHADAKTGGMSSPHALKAGSDDAKGKAKG